MSRLSRFQLLVDLAEKQKDKAALKLSEALAAYAQLETQQAELKSFQQSLGEELVSQPMQRLTAQTFQNRMHFLDKLQAALDGQEKNERHQSQTIARLRQVLTHRQLRLQAMEKLYLKAKKEAQVLEAKKEAQEVESFSRAFVRGKE